MHNTRAWSIWFVATLFVAFQLFIGILFGISTNQLSMALSINAVDVSNIVALYFFSYAAMQIPAGFIIDRLSIKYTLFSVSILIVIGLFMLGLTHSIVTAYFAAILMGVASSFNFVAAVILIGRWFNTKMFSIVVGMVSGINGLIASFMCSFVLKTSPVVKVNYIILTAFVGIVISILLFFVIRDYPKGITHNKVKNKDLNIFKAIYKSIFNIQICLASLMTALIFGAMLSFITFWNIQYQKLYHMDIGTITMINFTALLGIALGAPLFGWISEKTGKRKPVGILICAGLFISLTIILQPIKLPTPLLFTAMFFIGFFANNVSIGFSIVKENTEPQYIGTSIAFANTVLFFGLSMFQFIPGKILYLLEMNKYIILKGYQSVELSSTSISLYIYLISVAAATFIIIFFIKETNCKSRINSK